MSHDNNLKNHLQLKKIQADDDSIIYLPPKTKRIKGNMGFCLKEMNIVFYGSSKFVSVIGNEIIVNHHPLEFLNLNQL